MSEIDSFCRQVRARTSENRAAMSAVRSLPGQMVSILRQEVDSLVRVVFILSQTDKNYQKQLIEDSISGKRWHQLGSKKVVTDKEMVELTDRLHNWTKSVYAFGCSFIHLSNFHDHKTRDPMQMISAQERADIINHMRNYHGGPMQEMPTFEDVVPYLPSVFTKIADNLEYYVKQLERGESLD